MQVKKDDILSRFLEQCNTDFKYLRDIILNFVIAGKDTTAATLSWFIYMLCKHQKVQEKIAEEVRKVTNMEKVGSFSEFEASVSEESLERMQYLHAALTETLRLYPAVPVVIPSILKEFVFHFLVFMLCVIFYFIFYVCIISSSC